uniref:Cell division cycle 5-like protein n=1 Tax=Ascaris lumbricoides TaxID=6252 RepID=A0A9J2PCJ1_ASCLU
MVRVIIKGGVWRNTEDEILKAAIMKYGKNQWSRIASLLHRKSAKQCKARWYEWLDPGIKKTEWSHEEDEKLLHLAKLMPTQWRTIAPIVGRTAAQCLERYEHLLDEAQKKSEMVDQSEDLSEARKLKPGEIDPTPETKPARPDPIDMDEDELEMLSEARARLANTQGKKAKRKAREKQLSEARRLASLQKRRELRAAGIAWGSHKFQRRNVTHIDYSAEIPFEKPVPAGFHDPSEDKYEKDTTFKKQTRAEIEGPRRDDVENEERKKDRERLKKRRMDENPESIFAQKVEKKRSKLILPTPQISDSEMEQIVKIGHASDTVREFSDSNPTSTLLHDYQTSARDTPNVTQRTPTVHVDVLQKEAENLLALHNVQTPLKGGINTPLHDLNLQSALPQSHIVTTPNTVLSAVGATPRSTPSSIDPGTPATPFRDELSINTSQSAYDTRNQLRKALSQLPEPKNDYEIVVPEEEHEPAQEQPEWVEDASDVVAKRAHEKEMEKIWQMAKESQVVQRNLPKPTQIYDHCFKPAPNRNDLTRADDLIKMEMLDVVKHDVEGEPVKNISQEDIQMAEQLIQAELRPEEKCDLNANMWHVIDQCSSELILTQGTKFTRLGVLSKRDQVEALSAKFQLYRDWMNGRAKKTAKLEKRLKVKLAGYQSIEVHLRKRIEEVRTELEACERERNTFLRLTEHEALAANKRLGKLNEEVVAQEKREKELQARYGQLMREKVEIDDALIRNDATITVRPVQY